MKNNDKNEKTKTKTTKKTKKKTKKKVKTSRREKNNGGKPYVPQPLSRQMISDGSPKRSASLVM